MPLLQLIFILSASKASGETSRLSCFEAILTIDFILASPWEMVAHLCSSAASALAFAVCTSSLIEETVASARLKMSAVLEGFHLLPSHLCHVVAVPPERR